MLSISKLFETLSKAQQDRRRRVVVRAWVCWLWFVAVAVWSFIDIRILIAAAITSIALLLFGLLYAIFNMIEEW